MGPSVIEPQAPEECLVMELHAEPEVLRPGEETQVTAVLTNGCQDPVTLQGYNSCTMKGLDAGVMDGEGHHLLHAGAAGARGCLDLFPSAIDVQPQERLEESWIWNGTIWVDGRSDPAPEGPNRLEAWAINIEGIRAQATVTIA